jgi:hypothetical protein
MYLRLHIYIFFLLFLRNGQLDITDRIVCINDIYLYSFDTTLINRAHQSLLQISFELITTIPIVYIHAAVSTSNNDGHSCIPILSTLCNVDMVVR